MLLVQSGHQISNDAGSRSATESGRQQAGGEAASKLLVRSAESYLRTWQAAVDA